jgi:serine/threonine-protein kinase
MGDSHALNVRRARRLVGTTLVGKWHLDALLGVGGMAAVYAATHRNGKRVAVKVLHAAVEDDPNTRGRFLREGYVANQIGHPSVPSVLDDDETEDGRFFLVMDLLEGEPLDKRLERKGPLGAEEVLVIADQVLDVLTIAHDKGITHRDLKPDNLFLDREGKLHVLDFGIARMRDGLKRDTFATRLGDLMGSLEFMPPEQARGQWDKVDAQSDLWALGASIFNLLTGHTVHTAASAGEMMRRVATTPAPPLTRVLPPAHRSVSEIVDRALAFEKGQRWHDARAMRVAVQAAYAALTGKPIERLSRLSASIDDADTQEQTRERLLAGHKGKVSPTLSDRPPPTHTAPVPVVDEPTEVSDAESIPEPAPTLPDALGEVPPPNARSSDTVTRPLGGPSRQGTLPLPDPVPPARPYLRSTMPATPAELEAATADTSVDAPPPPPKISSYPPPRATTALSSAVTVPKPVRNVERLVWIGMAALLAMAGGALFLLLRSEPHAELPEVLPATSSASEGDDVVPARDAPDD